MSEVSFLLLFRLQLDTDLWDVAYGSKVQKSLVDTNRKAVEEGSSKNS